MRSSRPLLAVLAGGVLGLSACGSVQSARCRPQPSPTPPSTTAGQLTATADRAVVPSGGTVAASVEAAGPLAYTAPCDAPLSLIVIDSTDIHVDAEAPPAPKGTPCGAVKLAAGEKALYQVLWNTDSTLPSGRYRLVLGLGDQPQIVLAVRLGLDIGACG